MDRVHDLHLLTINISDAALTAACDAMKGEVELRRETNLADARIVGLVAAINAKRVAGFPGGRLFLDAVERALAVALVDGYAIRRPSPQVQRGGFPAANFKSLIALFRLPR